ncbi:MAG: hypothetical protein GXP27_16145 [Planctomycetes bacterium]|nr:hypothetical protein [Planctomycetota bacterium]
MPISKIFAAVALLYGATLAIATFTWKQPMFQLFQSEHATGITFLVAGVFFLPFVITFTALGLNTAEGEASSSETKKRLAMLSKECRMWSVTWHGVIGFIMLSWLGFMIVGDAVNPFFAFSAGISVASGLWFMFVYPTAKRLFDTSSKSA